MSEGGVRIQVLEQAPASRWGDPSGSSSDDLGTKVCPQCGQRLFDDMRVCYGCLYDFSREGHTRRPLLPVPSSDVLDLEEDVLTAVCADGDGALDGEGQSHVDDASHLGLGLFIQTSDVDLILPLPSHGLTVGRLATNDVVLHSRVVSKRHVRIVPSGSYALVENQGATNPSLLRGKEVVGSQVMSLGDTLNVCGSLMTLVEGGTLCPEAS